MFDEHQNFTHECVSLSQTSRCATRNSAMWSPPEPSSGTFSPADLVGRGAPDTTCVDAFANPNVEASRPRSAADRVDTGFFFAAMMPLKFGYRGSPIFSFTHTTTRHQPGTLA